MNSQAKESSRYPLTDSRRCLSSFRWSSSIHERSSTKPSNIQDCRWGSLRPWQMWTAEWVECLNSYSDTKTMNLVDCLLQQSPDCHNQQPFAMDGFGHLQNWSQWSTPFRGSKLDHRVTLWDTKWSHREESVSETGRSVTIPQVRNNRQCQSNAEGHPDRKCSNGISWVNGIVQ
jgi:hypothetical protein